MAATNSRDSFEPVKQKMGTDSLVYGVRICPQCGGKAIFKRIGEGDLSFNLDGTIHRCDKFEPKPIGEAVKGHIVTGMKLNKGRLTLFLSEDCLLEISSWYGDERTAINLTLVTPYGKIEEKSRRPEIKETDSSITIKEDKKS